MALTHESALLYTLLLVVLPVWSAAGLLDWICHRLSKIDQTSGSPESLLHLVLLLVLAIPLVLTLHYEISLPIFLILVTGVVLHQAISLSDSFYANSRRHISVLEQHVHGFMDVLPISALLIVGALYIGDWSNWEFVFVKREPSIPGLYHFVVGGALFMAFALNLEEFLRCSVKQRSQFAEQNR